MSVVIGQCDQYVYLCTLGRDQYVYEVSRIIFNKFLSTCGLLFRALHHISSGFLNINIKYLTIGTLTR